MFIVEYKTSKGEWQNAIAHPFYSVKGFRERAKAEAAMHELSLDNPLREYRIRVEQ